MRGINGVAHAAFPRYCPKGDIKPPGPDPGGVCYH